MGKPKTLQRWLVFRYLQTDLFQTLRDDKTTKLYILIAVRITFTLIQGHCTSLHLSLSLVDRWGTKDDRATTVLHSSLFSAFRRASPNFNPVYSVTLSSHLFFCLPLLLPPCTVPCRIIFASPVDLVLCPYHLSLRFFTVVRRSS